MSIPFQNSDVQAIFDSYPDHVRPQLMALRRLIYQTASETEGVGELEETLKWGEPNFVTVKPKSGSTIRIDWKERQPDQYAMYFICSTNLVHTFREIYPEELTFEGNRSIVFNLGQELPVDPVAHCISLALTYHLNKKKAKD